MRRALHDVGLLRPLRAPVPVISVGGLTAGGSGKTPVAAELARRLQPEMPPGIVTHGFPDEMAVHRILVPGAPVVGGRDRPAAVRTAARDGARVVILDGGLQRLSLWRDVEVVTIRAGAGPSVRHRLPAGSRREGWSAVGRADAVVVTRRTADEGAAVRLARHLRTRVPGPAMAICALVPDGLRPANEAARDRGSPPGRGAAGPTVAVASIMYPGVFLRQLREAGVDPDAEFVLPDHGRPGAALRGRIREAAAGGHVVGTLKDAVKLRETLGAEVPVWYLADRPAWERGERTLWTRLRRRLRAARDSRKGHR